MNDTISKQAVIDVLEKEKPTPFVNEDGSIDPFGAGRQNQWYRDGIAIMNLLSAQPERKVGKWNWDFADNGWAAWTCSICGWKKNIDIHVNLGYNYCPNCGARMEGEEDEEK